MTKSKNYSSNIFKNNRVNVYDDVDETNNNDDYRNQYDHYESESEFKQNKKSKLKRFKKWFNDIERLSPKMSDTIKI